mmetsp:Transcript_47811/g.126557  ORF Transcript_47811/g.126557 Transcript_47811/m.126557 type:complete len:86 (-) Transcript_47811:58-315(-)
MSFKRVMCSLRRTLVLFALVVGGTLASQTQAVEDAKLMAALMMDVDGDMGVEMLEINSYKCSEDTCFEPHSTRPSLASEGLSPDL